MIARAIGGTDISAILGLNPWKGPRAVFDRIKHGIEEPASARAARGNRMEPLIRTAMVERLGLVLEPHPGVLQHPDYDFATVSPDDLASIDGIPATVDYKSTIVWARHKWGPDLSDAMPEHIGIQLQWAMEVTGREVGIVGTAFGVDTPDGDFDVREWAAYVLKRDRELAAWMLDAAGRFWRAHILTGIPPPPDEKPKRTKKKTTTQEQPHD